MLKFKLMMKTLKLSIQVSLKTYLKEIVKNFLEEIDKGFYKGIYSTITEAIYYRLPQGVFGEISGESIRRITEGITRRILYEFLEDKQKIWRNF